MCVPLTPGVEPESNCPGEEEPSPQAMVALGKTQLSMSATRLVKEPASATVMFTPLAAAAELGLSTTMHAAARGARVRRRARDDCIRARRCSHFPAPAST